MGQNPLGILIKCQFPIILHSMFLVADFIGEISDIVNPVQISSTNNSPTTLGSELFK